MATSAILHVVVFYRFLLSLATPTEIPKTLLRWQPVPTQTPTYFRTIRIILRQCHKLASRCPTRGTTALRYYSMSLWFACLYNLVILLPKKFLTAIILRVSHQRPNAAPFATYNKVHLPLCVWAHFTPFHLPLPCHLSLSRSRHCLYLSVDGIILANPYYIQTHL